MKYLFCCIVLAVSCVDMEGYQNKFIETENCTDCIKGVQSDIDYLKCVPVSFDGANFDFVGTWFQDTNQIDGVLPIFDLRRDGVLRRIYEPGFLGNEIRASKWRFENDTFTETFDDGTVHNFSIDKIGSHYVSLKIDPVFKYGPMIRVQCEGFGFGSRQLPESEACDCMIDEMCVRSRISPDELCLPKTKEGEFQ